MGPLLCVLLWSMSNRNCSLSKHFIVRRPMRTGELTKETFSECIFASSGVWTHDLCHAAHKWVDYSGFKKKIFNKHLNFDWVFILIRSCSFELIPIVSIENDVLHGNNSYKIDKKEKSALFFISKYWIITS